MSISNWHQFQRDLNRRAKESVRHLLQKSTKTFQTYENRYRADLRNAKRSTIGTLVRQINRSDILFIGDFHTLKQSQKTLLRLLRDPEIKNPKSVALEALPLEAEALLQDWLRRPSKKKLGAVQKKLEIESHFGSDWEVYREIFEVCKQEKIQIWALSQKEQKTLKHRDRWAAERLASLEDRVWVLFGEYHCARPHIPRLLAQKKNTSVITVLQQNIDQADRAERENLVLRFPDRYKISLFALMHTPSWLKWQSYLNHIQKEDTQGLELHAQEHVEWCLTTLFDFFRDARFPFPLARSELLDVRVFTPNEEGFLHALKHLSRSKKRRALELLHSKSLLVLPEEQMILLKEVTTNSCAEAAGAYLYRIWGGRRRAGFYQGCLNEAISYFLSKILNHSRKTPLWQDWEATSRRPGDPDRRFAKRFLRFQDFSRKFEKQLNARLAEDRVRIQQALGRILGESLFEAFLTGEFSLSRILRLLSEPQMSERHAFETLIEFKSVGYPYQGQDRRLW